MTAITFVATRNVRDHHFAHKSPSIRRKITSILKFPPQKWTRMAREKFFYRQNRKITVFLEGDQRRRHILRRWELYVNRRRMRVKEKSLGMVGRTGYRVRRMLLLKRS